MTRRERIEAKLKTLGFPVCEEGHLNRLGGLMFRRTLDWLSRYHALIADNVLVPWTLYQNHGETAIASARERVAWNSCQVILHRIDGEPWAEVDIDRANPDMGVAPAVVHAVWDVGVGGALRWLKRFRKEC